MKGVQEANLFGRYQITTRKLRPTQYHAWVDVKRSTPGMCSSEKFTQRVIHYSRYYVDQHILASYDVSSAKLPITVKSPRSVLSKLLNSIDFYHYIYAWRLDSNRSQRDISAKQVCNYCDCFCLSQVQFYINYIYSLPIFDTRLAKKNLK